MAKKKKRSLGKKIVAGTLATAAVIGATTWGALTWQGRTTPVALYQATVVTDGDTFVTAEKQHIRLAAVDAPEMGRCGSQEAKEGLEQLVLGQPIELKFIYRDSFNRMISYVYTPSGSVNQMMLERGLVYYSRPPADTPSEFQAAVKTAKERELGIYGPKCTQLENKANPKCVIKGNISQNNDHNLTYRFPGCGQYNSTFVQLYRGETWFCTEKEAQRNGFTKGGDCLDKTWP